VTVGLGDYVAGAAELVVVVGAAAFAAARVRARLLPGWTGAPARLAEAVLAIAFVVWVAQLLGLVGLLEEPVFVAFCAVAGLGIGFAAGAPSRDRRSTGPPAPAVSPLELLVTLGLVAVVFAHWGFETQQSLNNAITNFDSRWYHLPFAAEFVQEGSVTGLHFTDPLFLNWFYPQNSELLDAVAILLTERDTLALFLNLGWLGLALLSAWCAGRPYGRGPHAVAAAAIVLEAHTIVVREPGTAKNDVVAAALFLAAVAVLLNAYARRRPGSGGGLAGGPAAGAIAVAGLAAGLACGTKLTVLAPVAALTVAVIVLSPTGMRWRTTALWGLPLVAGGAFWYLRNLFHAANPLPWITEVGPLSVPGPERLQEARPDFAVAHYATDLDVWGDWFGPGLHDAFGALWPLLLIGAIAGMVLAMVRGFAHRRGHRLFGERDGGDRLLGALGAVALFGVLAYLFTPLGAAGEEGMPVAFEINVRFAIPALILGLVLFAVTVPARGPVGRWGLLIGLVAVLAITDDPFEILTAPERAAGAGIAFAFVLVPAALWELRRRGLPGPVFAAGLGALAVAVLAAGYLVQDSYLEDRFQGFESAADVDEPWRFAGELSGARIGLAGTTAGFYSYGFYGADLSNEVTFLGRHGPKGAFSAIETCEEFRRAVNESGVEYLVTAPELNFADSDEPLPSPEGGWVRDDPAARPEVRDGDVTVWRISGRLDPEGC
jgi:hypothetical protein